MNEQRGQSEEREMRSESANRRIGESAIGQLTVSPILRFAHSPLFRRGVAEIELILSCALLITILMLLQGAMRVGVARLTTSQDASFQAFRNATAGATPQYTGDSTAPLIDGYSSIRPGLPNRIHSPNTSSSVTVFTGNTQPLSPIDVAGKAAVPAPFWIYRAYPVPADQALTEQWFVDYAAESHTTYADAMGLAPAWPP